MKRKRLMASIQAARDDVAQMAKAFPAAFDQNGRPLIAALQHPNPPTKSRRSGLKHQRGHMNLEPVIHLLYALGALGFAVVGLLAWLLYRGLRVLSRAVVRLVAALGLVLWCVISWPILWLTTPAHLTVWGEFTEGARWLVKRFKMGGL